MRLLTGSGFGHTAEVAANNALARVCNVARSRWTEWWFTLSNERVAEILAMLTAHEAQIIVIEAAC